MLLILIEELLPKLRAAYIPLFSDNYPTVVWVKQLVERFLLVAMQLV